MLKQEQVAQGKKWSKIMEEQKKFDAKEKVEQIKAKRAAQMRKIAAE